MVLSIFKFLAPFLMVLLFNNSLFIKEELPKYAIKKMDKIILKLFPEKKILRNQIKFTNANQVGISFSLQKDKLFKLNNNDSTLAYMYLSKAPSKFDDFDYILIVDLNFKILNSRVLVYREDQGGEIGSTRWLKQFVGKTTESELKIGYDIDGISGATISTYAFTKGVKRLLKQLKQLKSKNII